MKKLELITFDIVPLFCLISNRQLTWQKEAKLSKGYFGFSLNKKKP
jgi:hypothetical protein